MIYRSLWYGDIVVPAGSMKEIAASIAAREGIPLAQLRSQDPKRALAHLRQEAMFRMYIQQYPDGSPRFSLPMIGGFFGRDHTTILYGIRAHCERAGVSFEPRKGARKLNAIRSKVMAIRRLAA